MSIRDIWPIGTEAEAQNAKDDAARKAERRERLSASGDGLEYTRSPCFVNGKWVRYDSPYYYRRGT